MSLTAGEELELIYVGLKTWLKADPKGPPEVRNLVRGLVDKAGFAQMLQKRWERERQVPVYSPHVSPGLMEKRREEERADAIRGGLVDPDDDRE